MQNRRDFIKLINMAALSGMAGMYSPRLLAAAAEESLCDVARKAGLRYGSHSEIYFDYAPTPYQNLFLKHSSLYAPNLSWKLAFPQPNSNSIMWEDGNIAYANNHNIPLTGGHLLWDLSCPSWFSGVNDPESTILNYTKAINTKYGKNTYSWNVVNEAINIFNSRADCLDENRFFKKMGPGYFKVAFEAAKSVAPNILRVYNDFGVELDNANDAKKRKALLNLLDRFKKDGTPVNAVGLQSHLKLDDSQRFNEKVYRDFLTEISSRGFKILITEFDVSDLSTRRTDIAGRDGEVADLYKKFLSVALDEPAVKALITWGISDKYTWMNPKSDPSSVHKDKQLARPLPFDDDFKTKPAFNALLNALKHAPKRKYL
ncbi:MAG: endo-1,4-beta-xylanase [Bacteroidota bacterium]